jgi:diguanylate cyclase (GGDEF)-like protein
MWPGGFILLTGLGFLRPTGLPAWAQPLIHLLPYGLLIFGLLSCWIFNHSRIGLSLLVLIIGDQSFLWLPPHLHTGGESSDPVFQLTALLIPLTILLLTLVKHDAILTRTTLLWGLFILLQAMIAGWLAHSYPTMIGTALNSAFLPPTSWSYVGQPAMLAVGIALTLQITQALVAQSEIEKGFVWAHIAVVVALYSVQMGWEPRPFLALAGLILVMSLMQASYRSAFRDEVTRLPGSRAFEMAVKRLGRRFSLAIVEIDQLKEINNQFGRSVGDQVLTLVAKKIVHASGKGKVFAYDAEHFVLLFPATSPQDTLVSLEQIRKAVEAACFVLQNRKLVRNLRRTGGHTDAASEDLPVTVSIGVCGTDNGAGMLTGIVKTAYQAVHGAKSEGGNIVKRLALDLQGSARSLAPHRPHDEYAHRRTAS